METFQRKRMGQTAVSDNQSSSVTLSKLAKEARKTYCNFEFQERSHTMTDINPTGAHKLQILQICQVLLKVFRNSRILEILSTVQIY